MAITPPTAANTSQGTLPPHKRIIAQDTEARLPGRAL
jgi:hypothetical protein